MLLAYKDEAYPGNLDGRSVYPMTLTPFGVSKISPFLQYSQLPPFSAARSTMTDPFLIESTISLVINFGAGFPGIKAVVTIISTSLA
jgi:hypothetical protein